MIMLPRFLQYKVLEINICPYLIISVTAKLNLLTPNVNYSGPTAPLTSKIAFYIFIQQI